MLGILEVEREVIFMGDKTFVLALLSIIFLLELFDNNRIERFNLTLK
jgi:hypothetical protein